MEYYADDQKDLFRMAKRLDFRVQDKAGRQSIRVFQSIYGIFIIPDSSWTLACEKLFLKHNATAITLGGWFGEWQGPLDFLGDLPQCRLLVLNYQNPVYLAGLEGNPYLEDIRLGFSGRGSAGELDLSSFPRLKQCAIPAGPGFISFQQCKRLVSLKLQGGKLEGHVDLTALERLEEFMLQSVSKIEGVTLNPAVRLRSLGISSCKDFERIEPLTSVVEKLKVVTLEKLPKMKNQIQWLAEASEAECIALRLGPIPSINFLRGLRKLQVLDLFGSKVLDKDLSFRDSLPQEMDLNSWGMQSRVR